MASHRYVVLEHVTLPGVVQYVLDRHVGLSTLLVCGTKEAFLRQLAIAPARQQRSDRVQASEQSAHAEAAEPQQVWKTPTLRLLATSRTVKVAFCPDITHLRAYLATYDDGISRRLQPSSTQHEVKSPILAVVNAIKLHRPTSAFSAQGLNRTFSIAVEAAHHTQSHLVIAECVTQLFDPSIKEPTEAAEQSLHAQQQQSLWDEEISILNVTTKSFGAGERGWVGRTVKLRTIAGRWCKFETLLPMPQE